MKIFFIGTVKFSLAVLEKLINIKANVVGVATKAESVFNADFADLSPVCEKYNIPCRNVKEINAKGTIEWIESLQPDVIFCFGWSFLLKEQILNLSPMGVIGFHPAELPQNRGRHPLIWALALGLHKTASTFFFMDTGADSGDILSQIPVLIDYTDDAGTLYDKVTQTAIKQIEDFLPHLKNGTYARTSQNHDLANTWRKRGKADGKIDFRMSSRSIYNQVRALARPYVGAHIDYKNCEVKIWQVTETNVCLPNIEPGKILDIQNSISLVKCADNAVWLTDHEFDVLPEIGEYLI